MRIEKLTNMDFIDRLVFTCRRRMLTVWKTKSRRNFTTPRSKVLNSSRLLRVWTRSLSMILPDRKYLYLALITLSIFYHSIKIYFIFWLFFFSILGRWPNTYTFTKAVAEDIIRKEGTELPVGIFRPAIGW